MFHSIIKLEGHCIEKQIHNKLRKDSSRSDDFLSSYSCSKFEKCSFEKNAFKDKDGGQNFERPNVERSIFRKFETSNIEITKVELFDFFIFVFIFSFNVCSNFSNIRII